MSKRTSGPRIAPTGPRLTAAQPATPPTMVQLGSDRVFTGAREVAFAQITPDPDQPRKFMNPDRLAELSGSIVNHGLLQPIVVRQAGLDRGGDMPLHRRRGRAALRRDQAGPSTRSPTRRCGRGSSGFRS